FKPLLKNKNFLNIRKL
ncbi:unnamed protein product, partial [Allacma fusca]